MVQDVLSLDGRLEDIMIHWNINTSTLENLVIEAVEGKYTLTVGRSRALGVNTLIASLKWKDMIQVASAEIFEDGDIYLPKYDKGVQVENNYQTIKIGDKFWKSGNLMHQINGPDASFCTSGAARIIDIRLQNNSVSIYIDTLISDCDGEKLKELDFWYVSEQLLRNLLVLLANHIAQEEITCAVVNNIWNGTKGLGIVKSNK